MGVGHPRQDDAVVVFGSGQGVDPVALLHAQHRAVRIEMYDTVPDQFTVR